MYTPRALFSRLFLKVFFVLPLYVVGRLVTLPHEISFESLSLQIRDRGQSMVCVHAYNESDNAFLRYGRLKFSKMAAGRHLEFDPTGNGAVGSAVHENLTLEQT